MASPPELRDSCADKGVGQPGTTSHLFLMVTLTAVTHYVRRVCIFRSSHVRRYRSTRPYGRNPLLARDSRASYRVKPGHVRAQQSGLARLQDVRRPRFAAAGQHSVNDRRDWSVPSVAARAADRSGQPLPTDNKDHVFLSWQQRAQLTTHRTEGSAMKYRRLAIALVYLSICRIAVAAWLQEYNADSWDAPKKAHASCGSSTCGGGVARSALETGSVRDVVARRRDGVPCSTKG